MLINLEGAGFTYLKGSPVAKTALDDVDLSVDPGEFVALIGPTGCGKSTLVRVMAGLLEPTAGRVLIEGNDIWAGGAASSARQKVGLVFQEPEKQLFEMTVEDDVAFWPRNAGVPDPEIEPMVATALLQIGLEPAVFRQRSPFSLSGGEMRRAAIAGIMVMEPKVLILDEPAVGLDPTGKRELFAIIRRLHAAGTAVVLVSHDMDEVAQFATRILVMSDGKIILGGPAASVFERTESLVSLGLDLPQVSRLASLLHDCDLPLKGIPLTVDQAEEAVLEALGKGRP